MCAASPGVVLSVDPLPVGTSLPATGDSRPQPRGPLPNASQSALPSPVKMPCARNTAVGIPARCTADTRAAAAPPGSSG